jgi:hypothetical protein
MGTNTIEPIPDEMLPGLVAKTASVGLVILAIVAEPSKLPVPLAPE